MAKTITKEDRKNFAEYAKSHGLGKSLSKEEHLKLVKGKKIVFSKYFKEKLENERY